MTPKPTWTCGWVLLTLLGCSAKPDIIADLDEDAGDVIPGVDAGSSLEGGSSAGPDARAPSGPTYPPGSRAEYCAGQGSVPTAPSAGGPVVDRCTGQVASQSFRYALCACDGVQLSGGLRTAAFDSGKGPFTPGGATQTGASVGVNATLSAVGTMDIGGSLTVAGAGGMSFPGTATVRGDLRVRGPLSFFR